MASSNLLNYRVIGDGYPVLFLHGFLESIEMWNYFSFENEFQCILIDLPGHGNSTSFKDEAKQMRLMALEVQKIVEHLELNEFAIVGHSMGGYVGLELQRLEQKCRKLVLLNSNFWEDSELKKVDRKRVAAIVRKNKSHFLYEAIPNLFNNPQIYDAEIKSLIEGAKKMNEVTIGDISLAMAQRQSFENELEAISNKLMIIQGAFDPIVPKEKMVEAVQNTPMLEVHFVESGHMAHIEQTVITKQIISKFIKRS